MTILRRGIFSIVGIGAFVYALIVAFVYFRQEKLIFQPSPLAADHQFSIADVREVKVPVDGAELSALHLRLPDPKGVVLTHANLLAERDAAFSVVTVTDQDALLGVLPLFHSLAQVANLLLPFAAGARVVYLETVNSGNALIGIPGAGVQGNIVSGALEQSNVDLAQQFTDMIIAQRGFQAATKVITNADQLLQDIVNLRR